tara:strand:+ start:226 stop:561 length:336 start_codon:yes stop_codon:yes gene_type:complete
MSSHKEKFNRKFKQPEGTSNSLTKIAKLTGIPRARLQKIYNKGIGAWKTNVASVRLKSGAKAPSAPRSAKMGKQQWAMARVYSAVTGGKAAKVDKNELAGKTAKKKEIKKK